MRENGSVVAGKPHTRDPRPDRDRARDDQPSEIPQLAHEADDDGPGARVQVPGRRRVGPGRDPVRIGPGVLLWGGPDGGRGRVQGGHEGRGGRPGGADGAVQEADCRGGQRVCGYGRVRDCSCL